MTAPLLCAAAALALSACQSQVAPPPGAPTPPAPPAAAASAARACPAGQWRVDDVCRPAESAFAAPDGRQFVVDQTHAAASDDGPGAADRPWRTISRAARAGVLRPGDAVVIRAGVYRESIHPESGGTGPDARVTFAAWPGERVVVTGADVTADGWQRTPDGAWRRAWTGPSLESYSDDPVFRREMVVVGGVVLQPVADRAELAPGRFWTEGTDRQPTAIVARFAEDQSPAAAGPVETAHRTRLFWPQGPDPHADCGDSATPGWLRVVGITFRHAANRAQWGAVCAGSEGGLIEDVRVEWTNGRGIDISGRRHTFRQSRADLNGQMGWGGSCTGCLIEDGAAVGNNWKGHDPFWEAGGAKWTRTSDTTVRRFYAAHNGGPGIWLDIDNDRNTVEGSLVVGNEVAGIMLELRTTRTLVQHNVVAATRWRALERSWHLVSGGERQRAVAQHRRRQRGHRPVAPARPRPPRAGRPQRGREQLGRGQRRRPARGPRGPDRRPQPSARPLQPVSRQPIRTPGGRPTPFHVLSSTPRPRCPRAASAATTRPSGAA